MKKVLDLKKLMRRFKKTWAYKAYLNLADFISKHRLKVIGLALVLFLIVLGASSFIKTPQENPQAQQESPLLVKAFRFGEAALSEEAVGTITNRSTITLVAQSPGPVSVLKVKEGQQVWRGSILMQQESAYAAGNAPAVQRSIAQKNFQLADDTLKNTLEVVAKTREQADKVRDNTEELRKISEKSINETKSLLTTTEQVIEKIESDIKTEQAGANDADVIQALRQQLVTYKGILNQNRSSLRNIEYSSDKDNPPTKLADIQKDIVHKTTELQLKSAQILKDIAGLNVRAARIAEAATRVTAPFEGVVERVYVSKGQYLNPGDPVAVIKGETDLLLEVKLSGNLVGQIDPEKELVVEVDGKKVNLSINHLSGVPTSGQLFELIAQIPASLSNQVFEQQAVNVQLPLFSVSIVGGNFFVPLDSVFITNLDRYVFVEENGLAIRKSVETGEIVGESIEVINGLIPGESILLDRRLRENQPVELEFVSEIDESIQELG